MSTHDHAAPRRARPPRCPSRGLRPPYADVVPKSTGDRWMGAPEAAEYLGVQLRTLYKFIDDGLIPAYKLGRVIRLKREDVDAFVESQRLAHGSLGHLYPPYNDARAEDAEEDAAASIPLGAVTVSVSQAATMLGISRAAAFSRAKRGELAPGVPALRLGRRLTRVSRMQLEDYLAKEQSGDS